jgi:hypothetical protein
MTELLKKDKKFKWTPTCCDVPPLIKDG